MLRVKEKHIVNITVSGFDGEDCRRQLQREFADIFLQVQKQPEVADSRIFTRIQAIKLIRYYTKTWCGSELGLKEAKDFVERYMEIEHM